MKYPRQNSLVKLKKDHKEFYSFDPEEDFIFFGEIPNMPGHCVLFGMKSRKIHTGYHIEAFIELTEEEV